MNEIWNLFLWILCVVNNYSSLSMTFLFVRRSSLAYFCDSFMSLKFSSFDGSEDSETVFMKLSVFYIRLERS